ncbi:hypothetical protein QFC21_005908 [Naganishia friedmannii]|uniref:Uncharacterized protein n=1 Tax=Naganishia friedmannii TaxID=89922 RepID=A0ACC2V5Y9_9TREE|nr:hypothetical protein QFC21_005908 [Naganishia friedmannii]
MIPPEYHLPFFDTPLGFALVVGLISIGFYVFVGKWKSPADYHRQGEAIGTTILQGGKDMSQEQGNTKEGLANAAKGQGIETAASIMAPVSSTLSAPKDDPITLSELANNDGRTPQTPIWLAIKGTVFDVTPKRAMYGPGAGYHVFAGKDGSVGLGKSSLKPEDAIPDYTTLEPAEMKVLDQWYDFFSKRYNVVGKVVPE